jgi:Fe-S oxidoreductase
VTKLETLTPHGWALTIASVQRDLLTWNSETVAALYHCADCGTCRAHCVTDQPLPDAIAAARAQVVARGLAPQKAYVLAETLKKWGNAYGQPLPERAPAQGEIALFVGDDAHFGRPAAVEAALALLTTAGVTPVVVGRGRNSGYLPSSLGFPDTARSLAQANLDEISASKCRQLLTLTPGDCHTLGQLYQDRLGLALPDGVVVEEVTAFLDAQAQEGRLGFARLPDEASYAYLDPTHAVRIPGRAAGPRRLLAQIMASPARELFWSRERAHPSGSTALQYTMPHLAMMLANARLEDARNVGAELVVNEAPGDLALLERLAPRHGVRVVGLFELLAQQVVR